MTTFGYARCSSISQSLDIQIADLNANACQFIRQEKVSGRTRDDRPELRTILDFMQKGDILMVTRLDRLARSTLDLCQIVKELEQKGCTLRATQQSIDTSTPLGRMMVQLLGVFAEFENEIRRERQAAGIALGKQRGVYKGRARKYDTEAVFKAYEANKKLGATKLARKLGCSKHTIYRCLREKGVELGKAP